MADIVYRANISTQKIPLLSTDGGRSVVVPQQDQSYVRGVTGTEDAPSAIGIPQLYYIENVFPTDGGYQSVGYSRFIAPDPAIAMIEEAYEVRNDIGNAALIGFAPSTGNFYAYIIGFSAWQHITQIPAAVGKRVSVAHASGTSYLYISNVGCYKYNFLTNALDSVTLRGLTPANIIGLVASSGYLIAISSNAIAWSSTTDVTDFVPSLKTGAGGGGIESARGELVCGIDAYAGFIIFSTNNAVSAIYSGNPRYPFNFSEITGSGGLVSEEYTAYSSNSAATFAYTTAGLQSLTFKQATTVFPDVTDFLSGELIEQFSYDTNTLTQSFAGVMKKKMVMVANRYLIISYGSYFSETYTHAIVLDIVLKQYGKLAIPHRDIIEFTIYNQNQYEVPKKSIGIISDFGELNLVDFTFQTPTHRGVLLFGKYQLIRSRYLQLQRVDADNMYPNSSISAAVSLDGKTSGEFTAGYDASLNPSSLSRRYNFRKTGYNASVLIKGTFDLNSLVLTFNPHGAR